MSGELVTWSKSLPLRYEADVAVIGGGIAGVTAACAAARQGASVILVERFAVTGGNATVGGVANWSGETKGQGAIFDEIVSMQEEWHSIEPYPGPYKHWAKSMNRVFDHEVLAIVLQELLCRYGVKVLLHTRFVDARVSEGKITEVVVCGQSGPEALRASIFIDCSGEAQLAKAAGVATVQGREGDGLTLPPSMMFFMREAGDQARPQLPKGWFKPFTREEELPMWTIWPNGPGGQALKVKVLGYPTTDTESMTVLEMKARRRMWEVLDYFQRVEKRPWLFDHCSPIIAIREGRRVIGDYILRVDDLKQGREFDDAVTRGSYMLDAMSPDNEKRVFMVSKQEQNSIPPYQIPLRCFIARDATNLLMAGRCMSADQLALSSTRVMPSCAMMGQAVGILAGLATEKKCQVRNIDAKVVRRIVEQHGGVVALS